MQVFTFLLILFLGTSCNGQVKKDLPKENLSESKIISQGQPKLVKNLGSLKDKGNNIHCSLQDKAGNLWFGTTGDGVYKYDGKLFTQFTTSNGMNSNTVWCILEDNAGNIWFGGDGLSRYDGKSFTRFTTKDGLLNNSIWSILEDKSGDIWVGTRETILHRFDGKTFTSYTEEGEQTESLIEDIWNQTNVPKDTIKSETKDVITSYASSNIVRKIIQDRKGIEFSNGIIEFDVRGEDVIQHSFVGIAFHGKGETYLN